MKGSLLLRFRSYTVFIDGYNETGKPAGARTTPRSTQLIRHFRNRDTGLEERRCNYNADNGQSNAPDKPTFPLCDTAPVVRFLNSLLSKAPTNACQTKARLDSAKGALIRLSPQVSRVMIRQYPAGVCETFHGERGIAPATLAAPPPSTNCPIWMVTGGVLLCRLF